MIGIPIKNELGLNETQFGLLIAMPVLSGSLIRLPLGMLTDRFGGRIVFFVVMTSTIFPIYLISLCTEYWHYLVVSLFVGAAGGTFTVGISYCARWFPNNQRGLVMGIFGAGNTGAAVTKLVAPAIVLAYGWAMVPQVYAVLMLATTIMFWLFTYTSPSHVPDKSITIREQLAVLKDPTVWKYCQYYSIVFGGYVALALWMTNYYIGEYGFDLKTAALMAAAFSIPGGVLRVLGGYFSDRFGAHTITWWVMLTSMACLFILSVPHSNFTIDIGSGPVIIGMGLDAIMFTIVMFTLGIIFAIGKASVFKHVSDDYPHNIGVISGVVGLSGGIGGFLLPIMFGVLMDLTGIRSSSFMLMFGVVSVSLAWMYLTNMRVPVATT